jgi:hypothetical protein
MSMLLQEIRQMTVDRVLFQKAMKFTRQINIVMGYTAPKYTFIVLQPINTKVFLCTYEEFNYLFACYVTIGHTTPGSVNGKHFEL